MLFLLHFFLTYVWVPVYDKGVKTPYFPPFSFSGRRTACAMGEFAMEQLEQLKQCYVTYIETVRELCAKAHPLAGAFGFGSGPKDDPCHQVFYDEVGKIVQQIAGASPAPEVAAAAVNWLLHAPEEYSSEKLAVWMLIAAQGHAQRLIPFLAPSDAARLADWYQRYFPKYMRLPVQKQVLKALKKQGK